MKKTWMVAAVLGILSIIFVTLFSFATSPLYWKALFGGDSNIFVMLGKLTKEGMIPYKEFFDHKGPFIYFVEYIGQVIQDGYLGIFLVQIFCMFLSLCGVYKISRLFYQRRGSLIASVFSLFFLILYYQGGNYTEEYCLPFLLWSFYFAVGYLLKHDNEKTVHNPLYSFFYGITFMVCVLTRLTNALPLCIVVFIVFVVVVTKHQWTLIVKNILAFFAGMILCLLPFIIYFTAVDGLYEMFFGTILYNAQYAKSEGLVYGILKLIHEPVYFISMMIPLLGAFVVGICYFVSHKKQRSVAVTVIVSGVISCMFHLTGKMYSHYLIIWIPLLVVAMGFIPELLKNKILCKRITAITMAAVLIPSCAVAAKKVRDIYIYATSDKAIAFENASEEIVSQIPEADRDKVLAYNIPSYFYIATDVKPCFKYCILQDWQCSKSKEMQEEMETFLKSGKAKYIITVKENKVNYILEEKYKEVAVVEKFRLLKLK